MKLKNILLNITVGLAALFFGIAWVGVYNFFLGETNYPGQNCSAYRIKSEKTITQIDFDINDPNSVLPIDFEEEQLSDPKADEANPEYFDPEGTYFVIEELPKEFTSFEAFVINNKTLNYDQNGSYTVEDIAPEGYAYGTQKYQFENIEIKDGKISFQTKIDDGISFEFEGEFLVKGNFYTLDPNATVVKGTITKNTGHKKVSVKDVTFGWMIDFE